MLDTDKTEHVLQHTFRSEVFQNGDFHECHPDVARKITFVNCSVGRQTIPDQEIEVPIGAVTFGFEGVQLVFNCSRGEPVATFGPKYQLIDADL